MCEREGLFLRERKNQIKDGHIFSFSFFGQVLQRSVTGRCCCSNMKLQLTPYTPDTFNQHSCTHSHTPSLTHYQQRKELSERNVCALSTENMDTKGVHAFSERRPLVLTWNEKYVELKKDKGFMMSNVSFELFLGENIHIIWYKISVGLKVGLIIVMGRCKYMRLHLANQGLKHI